MASSKDGMTTHTERDHARRKTAGTLVHCTSLLCIVLHSSVIRCAALFAVYNSTVQYEHMEIVVYAFFVRLKDEVVGCAGVQKDEYTVVYALYYCPTDIRKISFTCFLVMYEGKGLSSRLRQQGDRYHSVARIAQGYLTPYCPSTPCPS